jgi:hypothetical protein
MTDATQGQSTREAEMRALAHKLSFSVEKSGQRFTLTRTLDVSLPERAENLTLREARDLLETWKLRGLGGGDLRPLDRAVLSSAHSRNKRESNVFLSAAPLCRTADNVPIYPTGAGLFQRQRKPAQIETDNEALLCTSQR